MFKRADCNGFTRRDMKRVFPWEVIKTTKRMNVIIHENFHERLHHRHHNHTVHKLTTFEGPWKNTPHLFWDWVSFSASFFAWASGLASSSHCFFNASNLANLSASIDDCVADAGSFPRSASPGVSVDDAEPFPCFLRAFRFCFRGESGFLDAGRREDRGDDEFDGADRRLMSIKFRECVSKWFIIGNIAVGSMALQTKNLYSWRGKE